MLIALSVSIKLIERATVAAQNSTLFLLSSAPNSRELSPIDYSIWGVSKIEEIKQRLVELWQSSNTAFE